MLEFLCFLMADITPRKRSRIDDRNTETRPEQPLQIAKGM